MKETEYNSWLEEAKTALDTFSAGQEELAKLYQQAMANAKTEHEAQKEQLAKDTVASKNQAVVDNAKTERDLDRTLASRGLSFSGENAQTGLDLALDLRSRLAELDDKEDRLSAELDGKHNDTQTKLAMEYAEKRSAGAEKLADMMLGMAAVSPEAPSENGPATPETTPGADNSYGIPMPDLTGLSFSARVKAMTEYAAKVQAAKELAEKFTPTVSAKELAKQLVSVAGENGIVGSIAQQETLETMLSKLLEAHDLSPTYLEELMLNLRSLGYRPDYREDVAYGMEDLQNRSVEARDSYYERYYRLYRSAGYEPEESDRLAAEQALFLQFVFLYRNSRSKEMFETAMSGLGYRKELDDFYWAISKDPDKYGLGSSLEK